MKETSKCYICDSQLLNPWFGEDSVICEFCGHGYNPGAFSVYHPKGTVSCSIGWSLMTNLPDVNTVLDFGCASSDFMQTIPKEIEYKVSGFDTRFNSGHCDYTLLKKEYDMITCWGHLEWMLDPRRVMTIKHKYFAFSVPMYNYILPEFYQDSITPVHAFTDKSLLIFMSGYKKLGQHSTDGGEDGSIRRRTLILQKQETVIQEPGFDFWIRK